MLENSLQRFAENLFSFLTGRPTAVKGLLVKKHSDNLQSHGDFSFPGSSKSWSEFIDKHCEQCGTCVDDTLFHFIEITREDIVKETRSWKIQVKKVKEEKGRVYLFLERPETLTLGLSEGIRNNLFITHRLQEQYSAVSIDTLCEGTNCLTSLRVKYLSKVIENLCSIRFNREEKLPEIFITYKPSSIGTGYKILCSTVLNAQTRKKELDMNADDFIRCRQNEMMQIAQHKYGMRVSTDSKWQEFIAHLGESAAAFELLQIKPSSAVIINCDYMTGGSSKGAAFILYNCARLETIIRTYDDKVKEGIYPALPDLHQVDLTLLTQEEEWSLVFNYIMGFPSMVESCLDISEDNCEFRPHFVCSFLCSMVRMFSQYYRKTRILVEPRTHLLPTIHARMHLLKVLNDTLKTCLKILNIKSVSQM